MAKIKCVGNKNNSILYLTDYGRITIATIFVGGKHNSYVVDGTDIDLGKIDGETYHFNLNNGQNEVYGHSPDGSVRILDSATQDFVLNKLLSFKAD